jgi:hypothetical protein
MAYWAVAQLQSHRERVAQYFLERFGTTLLFVAS